MNCLLNGRIFVETHGKNAYFLRLIHMVYSISGFFGSYFLHEAGSHDPKDAQKNDDGKNGRSQWMVVTSERA
jgi:hypothetical protein